MGVIYGQLIFGETDVEERLPGGFKYQWKRREMPHLFIPGHCRLFTATELKFQAYRRLKGTVAIVQDYCMAQVASQGNPVSK